MIFMPIGSHTMWIGLRSWVSMPTIRPCLWWDLRLQPKTVMLKNPLARGGRLTMDQSSATVLLKRGWGAVEDGGRWGIGKRSSMDVPLEPGHSYRLELMVEPYCFGEEVRQELKVHWNSERLARFEFPDCEAQIVQVEVPADLVQETGNEIVFRYKHTSEQRDGTGAGGKSSVRFLSIALEPVVEEAISNYFCESNCESARSGVGQCLWPGLPDTRRGLWCVGLPMMCCFSSFCSWRERV